MFVNGKRERAFKNQMLELFKDKIIVQTKPPKKVINFKCEFEEENLEAMSNRLKEQGIEDYTIEMKNNNFTSNSISTIRATDYVLVAKNIVLDCKQHEFIEIFRDIIYSYRTEDCHQFDESGLKTFVIDAKHKDLVKLIVKRVLEIDIAKLEFIDVTFKEYNIDGLIWFTIDCDMLMKTGKYEDNPAYLLSLYLLDCLIDHFIFKDINGKLNINMHSVDVDNKRSSQQGFRIDLNNVYRSRWEANFARILKYLEIPFEFEAKGFDLHSDLIRCRYHPDFFLPNNRIIEVKGFWDEASRKKVKVFAELYPNYQLLLIDADMYVTLERMYSKQIPQWEFDDVNFTKEVLPLVGITQPNRREFVKKLQIGDKVQLVREVNNEYDANAIKVLDSDNNHLGYIAAVWAFIYASKMDIGMTFEGVVKKIEPKVIGIQVTRNNTEEDIVYDFFQEK